MVIIWLLYGYYMVIIMVNNNLVGGFNLPLWKKYDFVTLEYEIPKIWKKQNVPNHQPVYL